MSRRRWAGRCASPTTPIASPCRRRPTAPAAGCGDGVRRHSRHRGRRRHRRRRPDPGRRQCDRRRMGPQPAALAGPTSCRGRPAIAADPAASRRFCPGPALAADHRRHTGGALSGPQIVAGAAAGDAECRATLDRYTDRLARALAAVINMLDPDAIVLGGGLSGIAALYDEVPAAVGRIRLFGRRRHPPAAAACTAIRAGCAARPGCGRRSEAPMTAILCRDCGALAARPTGAPERCAACGSPRLVAPCRAGRAVDRAYRLRRLLRHGREARPAGAGRAAGHRRRRRARRRARLLLCRAALRRALGDADVQGARRLPRRRGDPPGHGEIPRGRARGARPRCGG